MVSIARWVAIAVVACGASAALAQDELNILCSVPIAWCEALAAGFLRETGIKVNLAQKGASESIAQVGAERSDPKHDLWYGGSGEAHLQAADVGLTDEYRSPMVPQLYDWAVRGAELTHWHAVGVYMGALGIGYNANLLAKKKLPVPQCWTDLARPEYRGEVQLSNPRSSASGYSTIATLVQIFGEDHAFDLLKRAHRNVHDYPRTGVGAIRAAARGESAIAVTFLQDGVTEIVNGFPIRLIVPCEGTGYEVGTMSVIKGARHPENARRFYDWALTPTAQKIGSDTRNFQMPSNRATPTPPSAPAMNEIPLIPYDFAKYGNAAERGRLLERWEREVHEVPR